MDLTTPPGRGRRLLLALCLCSVIAPLHADPPDVVRRAVERAPALVASAQSACAAISRAPHPSTNEIEDAIRHAISGLRTPAAVGEDHMKTGEVLEVLAAVAGNPDTLPAMELQMLRSSMAAREGDRAQAIERHAYALAVTLAIYHSGDGNSPATAFQPCLIANEYTFAYLVLNAKEVVRQQLLHLDGRHYDQLSLAMADGSTREVFFDISDIYQSFIRTAPR